MLQDFYRNTLDSTIGRLRQGEATEATTNDRNLFSSGLNGNQKNEQL